jgi:alkanesulfonate monooxygenase SsuD/methylene tetrahydromethanopterin reductase-like flavin-dependent oxidoreductase (luciferase family)
MQFGIFYEHQLPRPWREGAEQRLYREALEQVELADRLGLQFVWEVEHHFLEEYSHSSAPEVFLAACSQRTRQMRLGHGIVLMPPAYNHPARVAERIATLDLVSDGRVEWGTGHSSSRIELEGFGIDPDRKREMWQEAVRESARMLAMTPYPGYSGEFFSMPARTVVPKPVQRPHPPLWLACSNRETIRIAARAGIGALTFAFVEPEEARHWIAEYYTTFRNECEPLGRAVNPNVAMVTGFMCHEESEIAVSRGLEGFQFFGYALSHYYLTGTHLPGRFDLWQDFQQNRPSGRHPTGGIGSPAEIRTNLERLEEAGVDQVIFIQQAGNNEHEHICRSLELFADQVLPHFQERHEARARLKAEQLAPAIERAMSRIPPLDEPSQVAPVDSYPVMARKLTGQDTNAGRDHEILKAIGLRQKQT